MLGRELFEPGSPDGVIDRAPDRLDIEAVAGHLLAVRAPSASSVFRLALRAAATSAEALRPGGARQNRIFFSARSPRGSAPPMKSAGGNSDRPRIGRILPCHRLHHQRGVGDSARHRRDIGLIAEGVLHLAVGDHAIALLEPDHAVARGRNAGRTAAIGCDRERRNAAGDGHRRAAAGAAAASARRSRRCGCGQTRVNRSGIWCRIPASWSCRSGSRPPRAAAPRRRRHGREHCPR